MINEAILLESRTLRRSVAERTDVLDKVKALSLLPDGLHVTTAMVADYFGVGVKAVRSLVLDHREELELNGYRVLTGTELSSFKELSHTASHGPHLAIFSRRSVLNVAMLLRDSNVARQVRTYLLDVEFAARTQPVDNFVHRPDPRPATVADDDLDDRIDRRVTHILSRTVVPLVDALVETAGEHRREMVSVREDMRRSLRRLAGYEQRLNLLEQTRALRPSAAAPSALDAMSGPDFTAHVAGLLLRDGCTDVRVHGDDGDRGADVTARTADSRRVVVRCACLPSHRSVGSDVVRGFIGTMTLHRAEVALYVATCSFSPAARDIAGQAGVSLVPRGLVEAWGAGAPLPGLSTA